MLGKVFVMGAVKSFALIKPAGESVNEIDVALRHGDGVCTAGGSYRDLRLRAGVGVVQRHPVSARVAELTAGDGSDRDAFPIW